MDKKYSKHLCAFIDILGYKNLVNKAESSTDPFYIISTLEFLVSDTIKLLEKHNWYSKVDKVVKVDIFNYNPKVEYEVFSDSIIITTEIEDNISLDLFHEILRKFCTLMAQIQIEAIKSNIIFRGSISIGNHYRSNGIMFSKALINAYLSESKDAIYPRIIIDTNNNQDEFLNDKRLLKSLLKAALLSRSKGIYFVDYLSVLLLQNTLKPSKEKIINIHKNHIEKNLHLFPQKTSILKKYLWLSEYHNTRIKDSYPEYEVDVSIYNNKLHNIISYDAYTRKRI